MLDMQVVIRSEKLNTLYERLNDIDEHIGEKRFPENCTEATADDALMIIERLVVAIRNAIEIPSGLPEPPKEQRCSTSTS